MNRYVIIFLICALGLGCAPKAKTDSGQIDSTNSVPEGSSTSGIHGGSPAPEVWSDCGGMIGDHPCDFSLVDQNGDTFTLYNNYGKLIVLDFSAVWCSVCNDMASDANRLASDYGNRDFLWVTVLLENSQGYPTTNEDVAGWVAKHGISDSPVLAGNSDLIDLTAEAGWPINSWPTLVILDREMIIKYGIHGWSETTVRGWVESEL